MYDFDADRAKRHAEREKEFGDRPFKFGGEVFYVRPNVGYLAIKRVASLSEASTGQETFAAIEDSVLSMIEPRDNAVERFLSVTRNNEDPITFDDLVELQNWLIGAQTSLPPTQEQPSVSTPNATGENSTED